MERDIERGRERVRERGGEIERGRERDGERYIEREIEREREKQTDRQTYIDRNTDRQTYWYIKRATIDNLYPPEGHGFPRLDLCIIDACFTSRWGWSQVDIELRYHGNSFTRFVRFTLCTMFIDVS